MEEKVFSLRSAILAARRNLPNHEPIQQKPPNDQHTPQVVSKVGRVRQLLQTQTKAPQIQDKDYYIDLAEENIRKRPSFTPFLREIISAHRNCN